MNLNSLHDFARLLDGFQQKAAALEAQDKARRAAADSQWQEQTNALNTAAAQLEQEYQTTENRRKGWATQYAGQAKRWMEELYNPRWQAVKDDCFLQCVSNRKTLETMSEGGLAAFLQERQDDMAATLQRLQNGFLPPGMSGVVGGVFPGYKLKDCRLLAQQYADTLCGAELLERCADLTHQRACANARQTRKQQEYDRRREAAHAESARQYHSELADLQVQFTETLSACGSNGLLPPAAPFGWGLFLRERPLPGAPLPPTLAAYSTETQLCCPVAGGLPKSSCFFVTDHSTALGKTFLSYALDVLEVQPDSQVFFADLEGLGSNYACLAPLAELGRAQIWSSEAQTREGLAQLSRHIARHYTSGGNTPHAPQFLFVEHLERNIPAQELDALFRIVENGPAAGVYVLFSMLEDIIPDRILSEQLSRLDTTAVFRLQNGCFSLPGGAGLYLCPRPDMQARLQRVCAAASENRMRSAILPLGPKLPDHGCWQQKSSAGGIEIAVGEDPNGQPVLLRITEEKPYVLTIGDVDVGKSSLHHTICLQIMANYSADEVRLAIGDFKMGAEFNVYAASNLPSVEAVVNDEDPDVMASFLRCYAAEMQRRQQLFEQLEQHSGQMVRKYETYRSVWEACGRPTGTLPRLVILIDEFQSLFENGTATASLLSELVRKGRTYGIHIIMASQRAVGDNPRNGFTPALKNYFTSRFVLRVPQTAARTVLSERCADTGRENSGIAAAPCLKKGHAVFNGYMGEMESENLQVQCYYPDDRTIRLVCRILTRLYGAGSSVLLKRGAPSPAPMLPPVDCLLLGASPCLHQDAASMAGDVVLDDIYVGVRTTQGGQNVLLTGSDLRMVRSVTQSAALYLLNRCPDEQVHVFGLPSAPLVRELQAAGDPAFVFHTDEDAWKAGLTRQAEQPGGCRVNLFVEFDTIPCFAQSISGVRVTPEAELLKRVLANASGGTVNLLYGKTFRNFRSQLPYAAQAAPIRLTAIGDAENLRAAMPETCRITPSEFDLPRADAIRAYYCNADSGKWGKVLLFNL